MSSEFAKSYLEQVPERCRKCPVLARFVFLSANSDKYARQSMDNIELVQEAVQNNPAIDSIIDINKLGLVENLNQSTDSELEYLRLLAKAVKFVDENCPGARRGFSRNDSLGQKIVALVGNERTCPNPNFAPLQDDPTAHLQLLLGNWDPISQPE